MKDGTEAYSACHLQYISKLFILVTVANALRAFTSISMVLYCGLMREKISSILVNAQVGIGYCGHSRDLYDFSMAKNSHEMHISDLQAGSEV